MYKTYKSIGKGLKKVGYLNVTIDLDKIERAINIYGRLKTEYQEISSIYQIALIENLFTFLS